MQCNGGLTYRSLYNALVRAGLVDATHKAEISENRHIYRLPESGKVYFYLFCHNYQEFSSIIINEKTGKMFKSYQ